MVRYTQHPDLDDGLARKFREEHVELFENGFFISTNNQQVVKSFQLNGEKYVIKRYPDKSLRAKLRSFFGISRAMNSFKCAKTLQSLGVLCPDHLFVVRHLKISRGQSFLIMKKSKGIPLSDLIEDPENSHFTKKIIPNLAKMVSRIHRAGLSHGDLHTGNIFILPDDSPELIDLDNTRTAKHRQGHDKTRLVKCLAAHPTLQEQLSKALLLDS